MAETRDEALYEELQRIELPVAPAYPAFHPDSEAMGLYDFDDGEAEEVLPIMDLEDSESYGFAGEISTELAVGESQPMQSEEESSSALIMGMEELALRHEEGTLSEGNQPRRRKGRKKKPESDLFRQFLNTKSNKGVSSAPKKEYLRLRLIRGFKRAISEIAAQRCISRKELHHPSSSGLEKWIQFSDYIKSHSELTALVRMKKGPDRPCRMYKYRSHNNAFCKDFFMSEMVKKAFLLYLDVVFYQAEEEELERKLGFFAVSESRSERLQSWSALRTYLSTGLLEELSI